MSVADIFTYTKASPAPTVTGISPSSGLIGTLLTITGTGFTGSSAVNFGTTAAGLHGEQLDNGDRAAPPVRAPST